MAKKFTHMSVEKCKSHFEENINYARQGMVQRYKIEGETFTGMIRTGSIGQADITAQDFRNAGFYARVVPDFKQPRKYRYAVVARRK